MTLHDKSRSIIRLDKVEKRFGSHVVLHDISLDVLRGQKLVVVGPSGSGKSTLLRVINHLERIDAGTIFIDEEPRFGFQTQGVPIATSEKDVREIRRRIGMVSQRFNLFPHLSVLDNIMVGPVKVLGRPARDSERKARQLLEEVDLPEKAFAFPAELSGGQQQRVAIARALAMEPEAVLFDEVTSALDPELVGEVLKTMRKLASTGTTMIVVTHEMQFARDVADQVMMMDAGRIVEAAAPEAFFTRPANERTQTFLQSVFQR